MIHVIAVITTKAGQRQQVLDAFRRNMPAVHAEKGCIEYRPVVDAADAGPIQTPIGADSFMVIEKWDSMEDLTAHASSAHMAAYANEVKALIADRAVHVLTDVSK
ncbi:antibiotic biosynthesis monooxygenase [Chromatiales bacterium (ex Bugula neritina AB1)]|nr:antibiotic biosynthesis monooxygenase [Chromatiales bacterium (ex Bugula neritina AB1)]